jgi:hypothetical protein
VGFFPSFIRRHANDSEELLDQQLLGTLLSSVLGCGNARALELENPRRLPDIVEYFCRIQIDGVHNLESNVKNVVSEVCLKLITEEPGTPMESRTIDRREISERTALNRLSVCAAYARPRQPDTPIQRLTIDWIFEYFRNMQDLDLDTNQNTR